MIVKQAWHESKSPVLLNFARQAFKVFNLITGWPGLPGSC